MDSLELDLADALSEDFAAERRVASREIARRIHPVAPTGADSIAARAAVYRDDIEGRQQEILAIGRARDLAVRDYEAERDEAERAFIALRDHLNRQINHHIETAAANIATQDQMRRSSEAALAALFWGVAMHERMDASS